MSRENVSNRLRTKKHAGPPWVRSKSDARVLAEAERIFLRYLRRLGAVRHPAATAEFFRMRLAGLQHEELHAMFIDANMRVLGCEQMARGTIDRAAVHPRDVVKRALELNASAVVVAHNHPSGASRPSLADVALTRRLQEALALFDIRLIDHLVVAASSYSSIAESGTL